MKMAQFHPDDIIALVTIISCLLLISLGRDGVITSVLLTITGYYFGQKAGRKVGY